MAQWKQIWLASMSMQVQSLAVLGGLRIQCCHKLQCRSQMQIRSGVAAAVVLGSSYSSDSTPSLGTVMCCGCDPKRQKKKKVLSHTHLLGHMWCYFLSRLIISRVYALSPLIWHTLSYPFQLEENQKQFVFRWNMQQYSWIVLPQSYVNSPALCCTEDIWTACISHWELYPSTMTLITSSWLEGMSKKWLESWKHWQDTCTPKRER